MTDNKDKQADKDLPPEQRLAGVFRLMADDEKASGKIPDLNEIQDWHLGKLTEPRASEVKSHVARDPECYRLWSELVAAELVATEQGADTEQDQVRPEKGRSLLSKIRLWWTTPAQAWAGTGLVTAMLVVIIVMLPQAGPWSPLDEPITAELGYDWPYQGMSSTRGGDLEFRQKRALQFGMRKAIQTTSGTIPEWQAVVTSLPAKPEPCPDSPAKASCEKETELFTRIGVHSGVLYLACLDLANHQQQAFDDQYWQKLSNSWLQLAEESRGVIAPALQQKITLISTSTTKGQQCEMVRDVIYMSY